MRDGHKTTFAKHLRKNQTHAEHRLWTFLRDRRFDQFKFRRQKPIGPFIVDFCCDKEKLIIELDGGQHDSERHCDNRRTAFLQRLGYRVIRFWDSDFFKHTNIVLNEIHRALGKSDSSHAPFSSSLSLTPPSPFEPEARCPLP